MEVLGDDNCPSLKTISLPHADYAGVGTRRWQQSFSTRCHGLGLSKISPQGLPLQGKAPIVRAVPPT
jgi:hypothetical protein